MRFLTLLQEISPGCKLGSGRLAVAGEPTFKKHDINPKSPFEAAGVFDVDKDGDLDIVSGGQWYEAPKLTPHKVEITKV